MHYVETELRQFLTVKFGKIHENRDVIWAVNPSYEGVEYNLFVEFLDRLFPAITCRWAMQLSKHFDIQVACSRICDECDVEYTFRVNDLIKDLAEMGYCYV